MVKKSKYKKKHISSSPTLVGSNIYNLLHAMGGNPGRSRLARLWSDWGKVVGEEFAWVEPLGHKNDTLFLGVEDAMEIQEVTMRSTELLGLVNAYMESEYFTRLKISLRSYGNK